MNEFKEKHSTIYSLIWLPCALAFIPFGLVGLALGKRTPSWINRFEDFVDDPIDAAKEWLHCHDLPFGYQLNISIIMKNREPKTWDIIRKRGIYPNCDPEDLK